MYNLRNRKQLLSVFLACLQMINPVNVVKIVGDQALKLLPSTTSNTSIDTTVRNRKREVAEFLCGVLESITNSYSHTIEVETTLDHEFADEGWIEDVDYEDTTEETWDPGWNKTLSLDSSNGKKRRKILPSKIWEMNWCLNALPEFSE